MLNGVAIQSFHAVAVWTIAPDPNVLVSHITLSLGGDKNIGQSWIVERAGVPAIRLAWSLWGEIPGLPGWWSLTPFEAPGPNPVFPSNGVLIDHVARERTYRIAPTIPNTLTELPTHQTLSLIHI